jgi:hypothetical protein
MKAGRIRVHRWGLRALVIGITANESVSQIYVGAIHPAPNPSRARAARCADRGTKDQANQIRSAP